jgi:hypothetical protein
VNECEECVKENLLGIRHYEDRNVPLLIYSKKSHVVTPAVETGSRLVTRN